MRTPAKPVGPTLTEPLRPPSRLQTMGGWGYTQAMDDPPPGPAFTKRLWPKGVEIPKGWELSEELSQVVALAQA